MLLMLTIVLTAIALILLLTALETLLWWYTWHQQSPTIPTATQPWETALVFVTGISDYTQESLEPEQINLINKISQVYAIDTIIAEPFPWKHFLRKHSKKNAYL